MAKDDPRRHRADMSDVESALRESRHEASAVELDRIKQRALAQSERRSHHGGAAVRARSVAVVVCGVLAVGTTAVGIAATGGGGPDNPSAASEQYHKHCKPHRHPNPHRKCERPSGSKGGVLGVQNSGGGGGGAKSPGGAKSSGGANAGEQAAAAPVSVEHGTTGDPLPFTGSNLLIVAGIGLGLLGAGVGLRRLRDNP